MILWTSMLVTDDTHDIDASNKRKIDKELLIFWSFSLCVICKFNKFLTVKIEISLQYVEIPCGYSDYRRRSTQLVYYVVIERMHRISLHLGAWKSKHLKKSFGMGYQGSGTHFKGTKYLPNFSFFISSFLSTTWLRPLKDAIE